MGLPDLAELVEQLRARVDELEAYVKRNDRRITEIESRVLGPSYVVDRPWSK